MQITKEILLARRKEIEDQKEQARGIIAACNGAIQTIDSLIVTLDAPEPPKVEPKKE